MDVGNRATNVIPATATATFNVRHNDIWTADTLRAEIEARLDRAAHAPTALRRAEGPIRWDVAWREPPSECFLTDDARLIAAASDAVETVTGRRPALSTGGGTSDARFVKDHCPVVELGLVGRTMHEVDERTPVADIEALTRTYEALIDRFMAGGASPDGDGRGTRA